MSKPITDYLKRFWSAPFSTEELSSLSTIETSSSSQRIESDFQTSAIHLNEKKIHKRKQRKHSSTMSAWS